MTAWIISNFSPLYLLCLEYSRQLINVAEREKKGRIEGGKEARRKEEKRKGRHRRRQRGRKSYLKWSP